MLETHEVERVAVFDMFPATGAKNVFLAPFYTKKSSIYQDKLGTYFGKVENENVVFA